MLNLFNPKPLCIAHRGASSLAPENTLAAARKALEIGADMWELDVSVTADGELVVLHDDSLARTTNAPLLFPDRAPWLISTFTLAEVRQLDAGSWFVETDPFGTIAAGAVSPTEQTSLGGEPVPTLREALLLTREHNWRVNVEIKSLIPPLTDFPVVEAVVRLIESLGMSERVLLSSFVHPFMQQAKTLNPAIAVAALLDEGETWPSGLTVDAFHPHHTSVEPARTQALRRAGIGVNAWTVNDPAEMERLIAAGVTGLFTDFPQVLRQVAG
ncbi:MAG: glycerophosphodiester phosphodiesterase [Anaerolineales bacterium]|nr:glycerophosphodiester phosphodiesterase [Anaerolineales bacterium]